MCIEYVQCVRVCVCVCVLDTVHLVEIKMNCLNNELLLFCVRAAYLCGELVLLVEIQYVFESMVMNSTVGNPNSVCLSF